MPLSIAYTLRGYRAGLPPPRLYRSPDSHSGTLEQPHNSYYVILGTDLPVFSPYCNELQVQLVVVASGIATSRQVVQLSKEQPASDREPWQ